MKDLLPGRLKGGVYGRHVGATIAVQPQDRPELKRLSCLLLAVFLGLVAYLGPFFPSEAAAKTAAVTIFMLVLFITVPVPVGVAGLLGCWLFWMWVHIPPAKAFVGFTNDAPWFTVGAVLLGVMAETTGLAKRIAYNLICRLGSSYSAILIGMMVLNFLLTFLVPSGVAKATFLCTIAIGMIQSYGLAKEQQHRQGPHPRHDLPGGPLRQDDHRRVRLPYWPGG